VQIGCTAPAERNEEGLWILAHSTGETVESLRVLDLVCVTCVDLKHGRKAKALFEDVIRCLELARDASRGILE
jgi:hypothetical protein